MICPNTWPQWTGDIKEGVKQIINYFNINLEEYRMGKTKIFIRNPTTLFFLEEKREECLPRLVTFLQAAFKGFNERSKWAERKAAIKIQLYYKKFKFRKYFQALNEAFQNVKNDPNWGKNISWPPHPKILSNGIELLHKIHVNWRARMMITALSPQEQAFMRQKVLAYNIFKGNKPWAISRRFDADYLELNTNPYKEKYIQAMQVLFQTYGDTHIMFSDYSNKINRVGKSQKRGIVVTEKNIYKHDPKSYKVKKMATPLVCVTGVSCSNKKDNFIVIHAKPPYRDLVLDMGISGIEKFSEIVTVLVQEIKKLTGNQINVTFSNKISYNNSRTQEKPGKQETLAFENTNDPKIK
jgi:myosin-1